MPLFEVPSDAGETVQVDTDNLPGALPDGHSLNTPSGAADGFVGREHMRAQLQIARQQAQSEASQGMVSLEDAATNEQVQQAVLAAHDGGDEVDLEAYQHEWEEQNLAPVREELEATRQRLTAQEIIDAGRDLDVPDQYLEGGADSYLVHRLRERTEFDPEHGVIATDGEGNRLPGGDGRAFASPQDLLSRMRENGNAPALFPEGNPQGGGGSVESGSGDSGGTRTFTQDQIDSMSDEQFEENREAIFEAANNGRIQ